MNNDLPLISVVIPTYNRFTYLLRAIETIKKQTYQNIEIIVVNDRSTQEEYYTYDWNLHGIIMHHLEKNTREIFNFPCSAYVRNNGIKLAKGKYIAFCDDDDIWMPKKLELQLSAMQTHNCAMSSTDGIYITGKYDPEKVYPIYNAEHNYDYLLNKYRMAGSNRLDNGFPPVWDYSFISIHNCIITSSVLIEKELLVGIKGMKIMPNGYEDYYCWLQALKYTNLAYVPEVCFGYDGEHGDGQNY